MGTETGEIKKAPIFVALDVDDPKEAVELAEVTAPYVQGFKVGPRLLMQTGAALVSELSEMAEVFVDNKYYDIPTTMESAVKATFEAEATYCTVHAACGPEALQKLSDLEEELNEHRPFKILAVTVLTSFFDSNRPPHWSQDNLTNQVKVLAESVFEAGLTGVVCSAQELEFLRQTYPKGYFVTPGVRLNLTDKDDQKRVASPKDAIQRGANAIVVGRPIIRAQDPLAAIQQWHQSF